MIRITPTLQIAFALVFITCAMLVLIDSLFQVFPDPDAQAMRVRTALAHTVAAQAATLAQQRDVRTLEQMLAAVRKQNMSVRSLAVRRADETVVAQAGDHAKAWAEAVGEESTLTNVIVPLSSGSDHWGRVEVAFVPDARSFLARALHHPRSIVLLSIVPLGLLLFWVYMKRALLHLDPAAVIPHRVRLAFNVMTEGVAVLDHRGRVLLVNDALHGLHADASVDPIGKALSALPWLAPSLAADPREHPWNPAIREGKSITNYAIELRNGDTAGRKVAVNCAPILDERGAVRGCLATFDDITELHLANQQLSATLVELQASQQEIERKNSELEHLATHDVLTGCLTRRAFFDRMTKAFQDARDQGSPLSCAVLDIDRFKSVNDTLGHATGDRVVQEVGRQLQVSFRGTDIVGRCGGDEFFIGMPGCDLEAAARIAEAMRQAVELECGPRVPGAAKLKISISVGVAGLEQHDISLAHLLERTDQALYAAKSAGRNRVAKAAAADSGAEQSVVG